ncbi:hypothetical protein NE865_02826 [Phthorimaea operculella]|nr:hypothetical protein NE865_02826 [Phthorimaea operculella]
MYSTSLDVQCYYEYFLTFCEFCQGNGVPNCNNRFLDVVLSNLTSYEVVVKEECDYLVSPDPQHPPLNIQCLSRTNNTQHSKNPKNNGGSSKNDKLKWNFFKCDFIALYASLLEVDWSFLYQITDVEEAITAFYDKINTLIDKYTPKKRKQTANEGRSYPEWYTPEIIKDIQTKAEFHTAYKNGCPHAYIKFSYYRALVKNKIDIAYDEFKDKIGKQFIADPRSFWKYVQNKRSKRGKPRVSKDGAPLEEHECATFLAEYFRKVYGPNPPHLIVEAAETAAGPSDQHVCVPYITLKEVHIALKHLKAKKSAGPDGIPPYIVKDCSIILAEPLLHLYNLCLSTATYPEQWKTTRVTPVPKGGLSTDVSISDQ